MKIVLLLLVLFVVCDAKKYKPVVLLHGILTGNDTMINIRDRILEVSNSYLLVFYLKKINILIIETPWYCDLQ